MLNILSDCSLSCNMMSGHLKSYHRNLLCFVNISAFSLIYKHEIIQESLGFLYYGKSTQDKSSSHASKSVLQSSVQNFSQYYRSIDSYNTMAR